MGSSVTKYKDTGLNPETNYSYKVRAYNTVKKKHWYNKKTGKWQLKKPAKKYRGKSKKMKVKVYGSYSATVTIKTKGVLKITDGGYTFTASEVKAAGGLIERDVLASQCPKCGVYGEKVTFIYDGKDLTSRISGKDHSKNCHHCNSVELAGYYVKNNGGEITKWFAVKGSETGLLDLETGEIDTAQSFDPSFASGSDEEHIKLNNVVYCFDCKDKFAKPDDLPDGWPNHKRL